MIETISASSRQGSLNVIKGSPVHIMVNDVSFFVSPFLYGILTQLTNYVAIFPLEYLE